MRILLTLYIGLLMLPPLGYQAQENLGLVYEQGRNKLEMFQYFARDCKTSNIPGFNVRYTFLDGIKKNSNNWVEWKMDYLDCSGVRHTQQFYAPLFSSILLDSKCLNYLPSETQSFTSELECLYPKEIPNLSKFVSLPHDVVVFQKMNFFPSVESYTEQFDTVVVGKQVWMTKNLDVDHYRNGDPIPEVKNSKGWTLMNAGAWCHYDNDIANGKIYGKLYNWPAVVDSRGLCPAGWHVPSLEEWNILIENLGWNAANEDEILNNQFFPVMLAGARKGEKFMGKEQFAGWHTSTRVDDESMWGIGYKVSSGGVLQGKMSKEFGGSVRCLKDGNEKTFDFAEERPTYPGGEAAMYDELRAYIVYPEMEKTNQIEGTVYVNFVVETDGSISNIAVSRGVKEGPGFNFAAMRAVGKLKRRFTPAKMNGSPVRLRMTIPVKFSLRN